MQFIPRRKKKGKKLSQYKSHISRLFHSLRLFHVATLLHLLCICDSVNEVTM